MLNSKKTGIDSKPYRIGFDLDGVLLYNPARILRRVVASFKHLFFPKQQLHFYYPKTPFEQRIWHLFHYSSIFTAPGIEDIKSLVKKKKVVAYLVTARYRFLGHTVLSWIKKNALEDVFAGVYYNADNEQPHQFKLRMAKKLQLDAYVEDNYDIVRYLDRNMSIPIIWIYNIFDRTLPSTYKVPTLSRAIQLLRRVLIRS